MAKLITEWSDELLTGNHRVDSQHKGFVDLINSLYDDLLNSRPDKLILDRLNVLQAEAIRHFYDEEALLKRIGFPGLEKHIEEHCKLTEEVFKYIENIRNGDKHKRDEWALTIRFILLNHMLQDDMEYVEFLKLQHEKFNLDLRSS